MSGTAQKVAGVVTAALAAGLLALFTYLAVQAIHDAGAPPRLADPAPTVLPSPDAKGGYPQQYRGSFDPNARELAVLAIVAPLLTTVVGFYFGQRTGEAGKAAVVAQASDDKAQIKSTLTDAIASKADAQTALQSLHARGLLPK